MPQEITAYLCSAVYCGELFLDHASCKEHEQEEHEVGYDIHDPNYLNGSLGDIELPKLKIHEEPLPVFRERQGESQ